MAGLVQNGPQALLPPSAISATLKGAKPSTRPGKGGG